MVAEQTCGKIYAAIPAMIADCEHIAKSQKNQQQGFNYRGIDQVYNAVNPLLAKYKVFPCSSILEELREERTNKNGTLLFHSRIKMRYTFFAEDGSHVCTEVIGEGMDSGDKASNKAMSIAYKYALFQLLCIPTAAVDPDSEAHEVTAKIPAPPPARTTAALVADAEAKNANGIKNERVQEILKLFEEANDELALDSVGQIIAADMKAKKFTKANFDYLCSVGRQKRQQLEAMEKMNERFEQVG